MRRKVRHGHVAVCAVRRLHRDEGGQSLAIILALVTILFLMGSALATHASVALRSTVANEEQAGDLHAADAGAELGMWWQRNSKAGTPPPITVNGLNVNTTVGITPGPCPTPAATKVTGFESGAVSQNGGGLFLTVSGTGVTADNAVQRTGGWSLDVTDPTGSSHNARIAAAGNVAVFRLYLRLASLPAANVNELLSADIAASNDLTLGYQASSQRLTLRFGAAAVTTASSTVTAGTWYLLDLRVTANTNPRTAEWQIDGVPQTPPTPSGVAGSTVAALRLGSVTAADNYNVNFDDVLISVAPGDYPVGAGAIEALRPNGMGTHNTPTSFAEEDGTAIDANTYTRLDDDPMTSTNRYVLQQAAGGTRYIELTMADTTATCIVGVSGVLAYRAATTTTDNGKTSFFDGATERIVFSGNMSETTLFYKSAILTPAVSPWTTAAVNGLDARIGYSTDVSPNPFWDALLLEVATGVTAPGLVTVTSAAGNSTVTTTYTDAGSASPTLLSWSTTK